VVDVDINQRQESEMKKAAATITSVRRWVATSGAPQRGLRYGVSLLLAVALGAGSLGGPASAGGPFEQLTEAQFDRMMAVNVKGVVLVTQAALPELRARGGGAVVNISSISGKTGRAFTAGYAASKFAVVGLTQALAHELGSANIRVNAVCPGLLRTTMWTDGVAPARAASLGVPVSEAFDAFVRQTTPLGREQTPEDIGEAVVYLCRAENVTGVALNVAGGVEMH
jgi:meso-butanediol dehydrogenase/(S,S)-butanediol dehydrogenase/diacetyl reductase